ncbi:MAG: hypothetical protein AB7P00_29785, partial [Sandaracinaceae bacterium]
CWRNSNENQLDTPEFRIAYIAITEPEGSQLTTMTVRGLLNEAMQEERFNWLFRVENAGADGAISIVTGYGRRDDATGLYAFSSGAASSDPDTWCPVTLDGTLAGETVNATPIDGTITVPVFDETGTNLQIELALRNISIVDGLMSESRSCVGSKTNRPFTYDPAATLQGFIDVATARTQTLMVGTVNTSVCAAIAGSLTDPTYCDTTPQTMWTTKPDSLCDAAGCTQNAAGMTDVCDPDTTCNGWRFSADFAAAGVDITNGACP